MRNLLKQLLIVGFCLCVFPVHGDDSTSARPPYQRLLEGQDATTAETLISDAAAAERAGKYDTAIRLHQELLQLRIKVQGTDHWQSIGQRWKVNKLQIDSALTLEMRAALRTAVVAVIEARPDERTMPSKAEPARRRHVEMCQQIYGEKHPVTAGSYVNLAFNLDRQRRFKEAQILHQKSVRLHRKLLGDRHPATATAVNNLAYSFDKQLDFANAELHYRNALQIRRDVLGEEHPDTASSYSNLAANLDNQTRFGDAEPLYRKAITAFLKLEKPEGIATASNNLAVNLDEQRKYAEAEPLHRSVLSLRRKLFGEDDPDTAESLNNLGLNLHDQNRFSEAQSLLAKALQIRRSLGSHHQHSVAESYLNLATTLSARGMHADAQPMYERALDLFQTTFADNHPHVAIGINGLAGNLAAQGKYAQAQLLYEQALELRLQHLGRDHLSTARSLNNLATNLSSQERHAEAQRFYTEALDIRRRRLPKGDPDTATTCSNLALSLHAQGKFSAAESLFREALSMVAESPRAAALFRSNLGSNLLWQGRYPEARSEHQQSLEARMTLFGELHPETAATYHSLAVVSQALGEHAEALPVAQKAFDLRHKTLGRAHPETVGSQLNLAFILVALGRHSDAASQLARATPAYEAARQNFAQSGLDRALLGADRSPYPLLAALLAKLESPVKAWSTVEANLARGLVDELAGRRAGTTSPSLSERQAGLHSQLSELQAQISSLLVKNSPTEAAQGELSQLRLRRNDVEQQLIELLVAHSTRDVESLARVQAALPTNAALILWVDESSAVGGGVDEHWGCVVRCEGEPLWEALPGTGTGGRWHAKDSELANELRQTLGSPAADAADIFNLARDLRAQRIAPFEKHLDGVEHLYVVAVDKMAGIPVELLTDKHLVSYVPSGTFLVQLDERDATRSSALLALGDPVFERDWPIAGQEETLPKGGVLITAVTPQGSAFRCGLKSGDVLLRYGPVQVNSVDELTRAIDASSSTKGVPITAWRDGLKITRTASPGALGVSVASDTPLAIKNRRQTDAMLLTLRGDRWDELPGTRVEVKQITQLFGPNSTLLLDSAASEQTLNDMRLRGRLAEFRFLHFASHGESSIARALESSIVLSQDALRKKPQPIAGEPFIDGQLTAREVLEFWDLNADLVTLSACETALGRPAGGDGMLGFAQAFLAAGSRTVCLSLWKVDDAATALLMHRFYQNLSGKRPDLQESMPKSRALAEAKRWLRELSTEEALKLTAEATNGVVRSRGKGEELLVVPAKMPDGPATQSKAFAHPRYWAAFILVGDPN